MTPGARDERRLELPAPTPRVLAAVAEAAELWNGAWEPDGTGGRLLLPVTAGVRRGVLVGEVDVRAAGEGSALTLRIEEIHYRVNFSAVVILALGAGGGLLMILWPLFPRLLRLMPVGVVMAIVAWLLVASRLRISDPADFLKLVGDLADQEEIDASALGASEGREIQEPPPAIRP